MASVARTLFDLKEAGEDFEWYPTTDAMLSVVARDIRKLRDNRYGPKTSSILDIGAGDGRALEKLQQLSQTDDRWESVYFDNLFAIEKSLIHLANMPKQIVVIGTEFSEQTLVDKEVDIVFCNPPYSEYENWVCRILRECAANIVYLVIPRRWRECQRLTETVKDLELTAESLGEYDFETADRRARAKIEIVRFQFEERSEHAAFDEAIQAMLPELDRFEMQDDETTAEPKWDAKQLATGGNLIDSLVSSYDANTIYSIEQGKTIDPKLSTLLKLSKALRVRLGVLVGVENPMNPVVEPRNRDIYRTNKTLQNVWQCHKVCGRMMIAARAMQSLITAYYCDHSEQEYRPADTVESDRHTLIAADAVRYADALIERLNQVFDRAPEKTE